MLHHWSILTNEDFYLQYYLLNIVVLMPSLPMQNQFASFEDLHSIFNDID